MFLPEQAQQPQQGVASVTPSNPETTQEDIALMQRVLAAASRNPNLIPSDFMAYVFDFIQTQRLEIPIGQVFGYQHFLSTQVSVSTGPDKNATVTTTSSSWVSLDGPNIVGLSSGVYIVGWGARAKSSNQEVLCGVSLNGADPTSSASTESPYATHVSRFSALTISTDNSGLEVLYTSRDGVSEGSWDNRWMIAIRIDNA